LLEKPGRLKKFRGFLTDVVKELTLEKVLGESGGLNGYVEDCVEWLERRDWIEFRTRGRRKG
jgi:hypothetical protein